MCHPVRSATSARVARVSRPLLVLLTALALSMVTVALWVGNRQVPSDEPNDPLPSTNDPHRIYESPFRNTRPGVAYVGDAACADCHPKHSDSYAHHPMGNALMRIQESNTLERYDPRAHNPFDVASLRYRIERNPQSIQHHEMIMGEENRVLAQREAKIEYVMGSGAKARSYLINQDGYLFQSPITWYVAGKRWNLSPGYENTNQHFSRPVGPLCLFCHCNQAEHVPGTLNRYREPIFNGLSIGCERCHGPGELHVKRHSSAEKPVGRDDTIVNPATLDPLARDAICHQCHIQGEQRVLCRGRKEFDYRPGLPLQLFFMDFVDRTAQNVDSKFVNSVEQMMASRCYQMSRPENKLGCIVCHDPHRHPPAEEKVSHYRQRCLQCHTETSCTQPVAQRRREQPDDSCIACHMPQAETEINHTSITNHRIPRRPPVREKIAHNRRPTPKADDLVPFHRNLVQLDAEEVERNRGLAQMGMLERGVPDAVAREYGEKALPALERAVTRDPRDWPALDGYADALWLTGRLNEASVVFDRILAENPASERTLHGAGNLALAMNRPLTARAYFQRALEVNPWNWKYSHGLAVAAFRTVDWDEAVTRCQSALKLEPTLLATRSLLIQVYLAKKDEAKAAAEYEIVERLTEENRKQELKQWYEEQKTRLLK